MTVEEASSAYREQARLVWRHRDRCRYLRWSGHSGTCEYFHLLTDALSLALDNAVAAQWPYRGPSARLLGLV